MRYLVTISATSMLLAIGLAPAQAGETGSAPPPAASFDASSIETGRSAFTPSRTSLPTERPTDSAMAPASTGACGPVAVRDLFGDAYRACAARVINPTEDDELAFSVALAPVGFRLVSSDVFAASPSHDTLGFSGLILPADRFTVPAAAASR